MRRRLRYSGRVQGVGFRATVVAIAGRHAVSGWVRNEPDGTVLVEAQGGERALRDLASEIQQAMTRYIASVGSDELPEVSGERGFQIRR